MLKQKKKHSTCNNREILTSQRENEEEKERGKRESRLLKVPQ